MTTDAHSAVAAEQTTPGPSVHVVRARKLLVGGLTGGVAATAICLLVLGLTRGLSGFGSAALTAGLVLFFYLVGQLVMVRFADAEARTLMVASLASYAFRVAVLGFGLVWFHENKATLPALDPLAITVTAMAVVVGWLAVEIRVFSRLRIPVYDTEYVAPVTGGEIQ